MKHFPLGRITASFLALLAVGGSAQGAGCNIRDFMVADVTSINLSGENELAFVLTSTKEEFESAKKNGAAGGTYDLVGGSINWEQARSRAVSIAEATRFDYKSKYAHSYFSQNASQAALGAYKNCLDSARETPGVSLWYEGREGRYLRFGAFWVGTDIRIATASNSEIEVDGGQVVSEPVDWHKAKTEEIVVRQDEDEDLFLSVKIDGQTSSFVVVSEPPPVVWKVKEVKGRILNVGSSHSNPCSGGAAADVLFPTMPGGAFVKGSVAISNRSTTDAAHYGESIDSSPLRISATISQHTAACERPQSATGQLIAIERYPEPSQCACK